MSFDVTGALKAGYSPTDIANEMALNPGDHGFDVKCAVHIQSAYGDL